MGLRVRFQVPAAAGMKMTVLLSSGMIYVVLSSLVETDQCFRGAYCLHHQGDLMMTQ
jgi:hypothetical protein